MQKKIAKWCDEWHLAILGIILATRRLRFWIVFLMVFVIFGILLSLLSGGFGPLNLFFATDLEGKITILRDSLLSLFGVGKTFWDWLLLFSITFLQATLISLIVLVWKKRLNNTKPKQNEQNDSASSVQNAGIAAGLALLGSGCPTCGTALITPIIGSIFSSGSYAIAGAISGILTGVAIIILLLSIKRVGVESYVIIKDEQWRQKKKEDDEKSH